MLPTHRPTPFARPPLQLRVETSTATQTWSLDSLHKTPPPGFDSGWALLADLPADDENRIKT